MASLDRDAPHGAFHRCIGDADDPEGGILGAQIETPPELPENVTRLCGVKPHARFATQKILRLDAAEHDVCIGHCRLLAAQAVARRSRIRAGALGTDAQDPRRVDARDAPAARADRVDVDGRQAQR